MPQVLRIGNAQGFWGDSGDAPARLARQCPMLDFLTLDYLTEVSMSILASQRERATDPTAQAGYPADFLEVISSLAPLWRAGAPFRLIANAGGLNPIGCAHACARLLRQAGCRGMRIGVVTGDDVLEQLADDGHTQSFANLQTGAPLASIRDSLVTANAYLGARPIVQALAQGARIVITGRVADPSLAIAPCVASFGWTWQDYHKLASAAVAGHLIESGTQVTGGMSTDWLDMPDPAHMGFPIAEIAPDGSCTITKPRGTGGRVSEQTVKEQLLCDLGDPAQFLTPDVTVSFLSLRVEDQGGDRVKVSGALGSPPPARYKVGAAYRAGYRAAGTLTVFGRHATAKAERCGRIILNRLADAGCRPRQWRAECLCAGAVAPHVPTPDGGDKEINEIVLRVAAADPSRPVIERFTRELAPLITSGPSGTTGYGEGRPRVQPVFAYWPCLIDRRKVSPSIQIVEI